MDSNPDIQVIQMISFTEFLSGIAKLIVDTPYSDYAIISHAPR